MKLPEERYSINEKLIAIKNHDKYERLFGLIKALYLYGNGYIDKRLYYQNIGICRKCIINHIQLELIMKMPKLPFMIIAKFWKVMSSFKNAFIS